jgi:hypothetical protein
MHTTGKQKKSDAEKFGLSGENPEYPGNLETPGKSLDSPVFQHNRGKTDFTQFFNLS